ncbi:MAG: hypothetical protein A3G02_01415 [Candidatus Yanofskybacteria bacterium RIFCSPLOWO2_12_FULL_44_13b]|uniref:Polysaccharide biosynthesis protein C-terminal domain-containing protein n=1 Tax=Candidatus Yanofskybacteria bacterium RIFCSPLOWO2_02_FULL_44_18 TaxID=1802705 RepID=A0A1F8H097_9BACT|nr:MAG: hypothetical protein A2657_00425 [Candidatus Yanofskybacteria bacterium RIFCSPHIGHO2_01_FULL_44_110b]OGN14226.1 MAG: hypothetical protein A3C01_01355 [Candidatus Yanofskybacteria bacterium RIFCSPHIGHO2_02_FULL_44_36b]OGN18584.1 MAG: hypothetical protein A3F50_00630 [Candidatus Yanofskybacteria bacterium RIFCSPHIGHO2_12_FULL_44_29b]OGN25637.1 MAG: hypothetical protein A3B12_00595 [Candidatus Yanofskybacteria bacterium RIFCSPLOWO2_01_FULL_44_88]OGN31092.1 MAG: hypothetical protein A3I96_0
MLHAAKMIRLVIRILGNIIGIYVISLIIPGFSITGGWQTIVLAGVALGIVNVIIRMFTFFI